jgi:hypothetical protein
MENNDSPYIYEKPIRSGLKQRSKRLAGLSTLGLVGMFGVFGGSAIANSLVTSNASPTASEADAVEIVDPLIDNTDSSVEPISDPEPLVSIPLQEAKPKPNSVKVELPALPNQSYGNTSSATPSVGSGNYSAGSTPSKFAARGEGNERYEPGHESEREAEYEDD